MSILLWFISLFIELFITYIHFWGGLANPLFDLISSIPNLFFIIFYIFIFFIISITRIEFKKLFYFKLFILTIIYIYAYLLFSQNTKIIRNSNLTISNINIHKKIDYIICSQNTKHAQALLKSDFFRTLRIYNCNIILLQEVENSKTAKNLITQKLKQFLHKEFTVKNYGEFVVASNLPFKQLYISTHYGFMVNQFSLKNNNIIIINTHIWTPLKKQTPKFNPTINFPISPFIIRKQQTAELIEYLSTIYNTPTFIIGDFNMLPTHKFLTQELAKFNFFRIKSTKFITPTFSTSLPIIEIDHTFTNTPYLIQQRQTLLNQYSDHALQIIKLNIN